MMYISAHQNSVLRYFFPFLNFLPIVSPFSQGTCVPTEKRPYYRCECGDFLMGKNCEIENNPCSFPETNPCLHGKCIFITKLNRIICKCDNGWTQKENQSSSMLNWGKETVEVPPPCDG
ncbi:EGF-like membrane protein, putative [Plasmodium ovale wallikeri]|uniref:EGF-like membrane protein, putative n=1 Tax=Plasmodium ovale wallikeri TaxID=864142 RepID=A0A1A8YST9_PLAOA|nr:EGF-like membrane protein, putative [Plasmodium ovale wallikeri]SBT38013.1 EGF-like membrane protein, putative [Plasmodium ovale wallikeri]